MRHPATACVLIAFTFTRVASYEARAQTTRRIEGRGEIAALERLYDEKHDPRLLRQIARLYEVAAAEGDTRDAYLAIFYYELAHAT